MEKDDIGKKLLQELGDAYLMQQQTEDKIEEIRAKIRDLEAEKALMPQEHEDQNGQNSGC